MAVIDTSFLIAGQRSPRRIAPKAQQLVEMGETLLVPAQAAIEFASGAEDPDRALDEIERSFTLRPVDRAIVPAAARIDRESRARRKHPGAGDIQIAATAIAERTFVVTSNARHFRDALGVPVWDYERDPEPPARS